MYDLIVIGAGSGGLNIASFMNRVGFRVLLIDRSDRNIGGDCLNFGCVPSKALIHIARQFHNSKSAERFGLNIQNNLDLKKVMDYVKSKQEKIRKHENAKWFKKQGIEVILGEASFVDKNTVRVNKKEYSAKKIVIATGSKPRKLDLKGVKKVNYLTNETIFDLEKLPKSLVIIGGGPIGVELGQAFNMLGSNVTILERGDKFLPKESKEVTDVLCEQLIKQGVHIMFNTSPVEFVERDELVVKQNTKKINLKFDQVLVSIGRELDIQNLQLKNAGIELVGRRIKLNDGLQSTNNKVFVCGDAAGSYQFTHTAELHAKVIISNFFSPLKKKINYDNLNWVTYTTPEIATFGLNEKQLTDRKINFEKIVVDFEEDRAITDDYEYGKLVLFIDKKHKILGGSMVAPNAGELFQELVLANTLGLKIDDVFKKTYAYPTATRINKKAIGLIMARKLNNTAKELMKFLY